MRRAACTLAALVICGAAADTAPAQRSQRPDGPPGRFHPLIRLFDADQDGVLSAEEVAAAAQKLGEFDTSGDGNLTPQELREAMPLGRPPRTGGPPPRPGGRGRGRSGSVSDSDFEKPPLAADEQEGRILATLKAMREGPGFANVSPTDGRLLRMLAEAIGAKRVVEIGTSTGESAVWLALGLRKTGGHLFTHEIDEGRANIARANFEKAGVDDVVTLILGDAHETVKRYEEPIDLLFLDADKEGYIDYLEKLLPLVRPGGLIVAHNMNTRQADPDYVKAITEDPKLETLILLKEGTGVGVTLKKR
jgi:predicted O-methyltransferase YrrM